MTNINDINIHSYQGKVSDIFNRLLRQVDEVPEGTDIGVGLAHDYVKGRFLCVSVFYDGFLEDNVAETQKALKLREYLMANRDSILTEFLLASSEWSGGDIEPEQAASIIHIESSEGYGWDIYMKKW